MNLNKDQQKGFEAIALWLTNPNSAQAFHLHGWAGTGKTYLLAYIVRHLQVKMHCCAPTGKAASILADKLSGLQEVTTVHKLIYVPANEIYEKIKILKDQLDLCIDEERRKELEELVEIEKQILEEKDLVFYFKDDHDIFSSDLIIVDEASMVTEAMRSDLLKTRAKVLFVGDPGQLPPVNSKLWFHNTCDWRLEEVQRQALESPIIQLSADIRNGAISGELIASKYQSEECRIISKADVHRDKWAAADQIITGRNIRRHAINRFVRRKLGYEGAMPLAGEKIICLKNLEAGGAVFLNGVQGTTLSELEYNSETDNYNMDISYGDNEYRNLNVYPFAFFHTYNPTEKRDPYFMVRGLFEFDYAYAITAHKSQGSEWDSVIVADDYMKENDVTFRKQWLYTSVTRAKEKVMWVY